MEGVTSFLKFFWKNYLFERKKRSNPKGETLIVADERLHHIKEMKVKCLIMNELKES